MINSQGGRVSVPELLVTVTVESTVTVVGCILGVVKGGEETEGVVRGGRGTELLTIVTGPRSYSV